MWTPGGGSPKDGGKRFWTGSEVSVVAHRLAAPERERRDEDHDAADEGDAADDEPTEHGGGADGDEDQAADGWQMWSAGGC